MNKPKIYFMKANIHNFLTLLEKEIHDISTEYNDILILSETIINLVINRLGEIKKIIINKGFSDETEEIYFFKHQKPKIISKLIYYNTIYSIETKRPYGGEKIIKKYLCLELTKIKGYFDKNLDFYKYYRTNSTYLDHKYFVRGNYDIKLNIDTFYFEADHNFSTSHDFKVAEIIANDLIQVYIEDQLKTNKLKIKVSNSYMLNWVESKTALTELIYALHSQGAFGNADIIAIAKTFENTFNISLGDFYHTFMELKSRKINRTKFLDSLRDALIRKMDEDDERMN